MKKIDLFGIPVFLNQSGNRLIKTKCGSCLTILSIISICIFAYLIFDNDIISIFKEETSNFGIKDYEFNGNDYIDLNDLPLLGIEIKDKQHSQLGILVQIINLNISDGQRLNSTKIDASIEKCSNIFISKEQIEYYRLKDMLCISFNENNNKGMFKFGNSFVSESKSILSIEIKNKVNTDNDKSIEEYIDIITFNKYKFHSHSFNRNKVKLNNNNGNVHSYEISKYIHYINHPFLNFAYNILTNTNTQSKSTNNLFSYSKIKLSDNSPLSPSLTNSIKHNQSVILNISLNPEQIKYQIATPSILSSFTKVIAIIYLLSNIFRCIALSNNINSFFFKIGNGVFNYDYKLHISPYNISTTNNNNITLQIQNKSIIRSNQSSSMSSIQNTKPVSPISSLNATPVRSSARKDSSLSSSNTNTNLSMIISSNSNKQRSPLILSACEWMTILLCTNSKKFDKKKKSYLFNKTKAKVLFFSDFSNLIKALIDIRVIKKKMLSNRPLVNSDFSEHYNIGIFDNNLFGQSKYTSTFNAVNKSSNDTTSLNDYNLTNGSYFP